MAERPILFSAPMILALLAGTKTQTRRAMRDQPCELLDFNRGGLSIRVRGAVYQAFSPKFVPVRCPYGAPGDRLWVRESFNDDRAETIYRADGGLPADWCDAGSKWRPSIHMPRAASRITLEVTEVRVERLQDISEADAAAEGLTPLSEGADQTWTVDADPRSEHQTARETYRWLWEAINGPSSWDANPWVWAVSFKRVEASHA